VTPWDPRLERLFDPALPSATLLYSILEGGSPGEILVDDSSDPSQCLVRSPIRLTFASRDIRQGFLDECLAELRKTAGVGVVLAPDVAAQTWALPEPDDVIERLEFLPKSKLDGPLRKALARPLAGMEIREIDREAFDNPLWREAVLSFCVTPESFFGRGFAIALFRDEEPIAWSYLPICGRSTMEIGVATAEEHRGKGYATLIAAHAIERCLAMGRRAVWSCESDNLSSAAIARKLGFQGERTYCIHAYRSIKA